MPNKAIEQIRQNGKLDTELMIKQALAYVPDMNVSYDLESFGQDYFTCESGRKNAICRITSDFYFDILGWCGCGSPDDALQAVWHYLECLCYPDSRTSSEIDKEMKRKKDRLDEYFHSKSIYDNDLLLCLAYTLDERELTEHGTSISGAWLTEKGEFYRYILKEYFKMDLNERDI